MISRFSPPTWILAGMMLVFGFSSCIQFRKATLYDGVQAEAPRVKPQSIEQVVSPLLFEDDTLNVWGIVTDSCKTFSLTQKASYKGEAGLALRWSRAGCEWVGFGMGWDDYSGKNIEPLIGYAAFEMYVRTPEGKSFGLPMVFTLEDYSNVMAFCYTANKYFERVAIDEEWQRVVVPLADFNDEGEGIDYTNIKQLQIEMQQSGDVYVDEIKLVFYEEQPQEPWMVEEVLPDPTTLPQTLFDDGFVNNNGWGLYSDNCQTIQLSETETYSGDQSLHVKWDADESCHTVAFGVNWYKWRHIDITNMKDKAALEFFMKANNPDQLDFRMTLKEFDGPGFIDVKWDTKYASSDKNGWYKVRIPMSDFQGTVKETDIQHLMFNLTGKGEMFIDQMSWVAK